MLVDDLIATGGTACAACKLVDHMGGQVVERCFVIDLPDLGYQVFSLCQFASD